MPSSLTVLHLSDMQFGKNHCFGKQAGPVSDKEFDTLATTLIADLKLLARERGLRPNIIAVTGDLAEWGTQEEFRQCFAMLEKVALHCGIAPEQRHRVAIIPGNHDIERDLAASDFYQWKARGKKGDPFGFSRWKFYAEAFDAFYARVPDDRVGQSELGTEIKLRPQFTADDSRSIFVIPEFKVVLAGLNSTISECHLAAADEKDKEGNLIKGTRTLLGEKTFYGHHGFCGETQLSRFADDLQQYQRQGWLRIGLVHHNIIRGPVEDSENLRDSDRLEHWLKAQLNFLLAGHTHIAKQQWLTQYAPILSTGSSGLTQPQRPLETPPQYQVLQITPEGITCHLRRYSRGSRDWQPDATNDAPNGILSIPVVLQNCQSALPLPVLNEPPKSPNKKARAKRNSNKAKPVLTSDAPGFDEAADIGSWLREQDSHQRSPLPLALEQVRAICQHRYKDAIITPKLFPPLPYLSIVTTRPFHRSFAVTACEALSDKIIENFASIHRAFAQLDPSVENCFVHGGDAAATDKQKSLAKAAGFSLFSFPAFRQIFDLSDFTQRQAIALANDQRYDASKYVAQDLSEFGWDQLRVTDSAEAYCHYRDAVQAVKDKLLGRFVQASDIIEKNDLLRSTWPNKSAFLLVHGDFGTGKTFLLRQLALEFSRDRSLIPIFVELRNLEKTSTLEGLIAAAITKHRVVFDPDAIDYMRREGLIVLLFDGYDELARNVTFEAAAECLKTLAQAAGDRAKVVLTVRSQHFLSDNQMTEHLKQLPGFQRLSMEKFTDEQIREFLRKHMPDEEQANARYSMLVQIKDLLGLAENPRMLSFIAQLDEWRLTAAAGQRNGSSDEPSITAGLLYQTILDQWMDEELRRRPDNRLSRPERLLLLWLMLDYLALIAWPRTDRTLSVADIEQAIAAVRPQLAVIHPGAHYGKLSDKEEAQGIASGSLLTREGEGRFLFGHQSILEWFVARHVALAWNPEGVKQTALAAAKGLGSDSAGWAQHVAPHLRQQDFSDAILGEQVMTPLMAEFLIDLAGTSCSLDWSNSTVGDPRLTGLSSLARTNGRVLGQRISIRLTNEMNTFSAERQIKSSQTSATEAVQLGITASIEYSSAKNFDNEDLRGKNYDLVDFSHATFIGSNLAECSLIAANLSGADLTNADLTNANLTNAVLRKANLTNANFTRATLIGADLRGAIMDGSQWHMARLAGATLDDPQLSGLAAYGAGLQRLAHSPALLPSASGVNAMAFLPRNPQRTGTLDLIVSAHDSGVISLWDARSGRCLRSFYGHSGPAYSVAFSPDGQRLASGSADKTVRLWSLASGKAEVFTGHELSVLSVSFSPDGQRLASGSADKTVRLWSLASGKAEVFTGHEGPVNSVAFSPDGQRVASGSEDKTVRLWSLASGKAEVFNGHEHWVLSVAFSPDGQHLASGSYDKTVRLWSLASGKAKVFTGHEDQVNSVAFSPDSQLLASGSDDNTVRLLSLASDYAEVFKGHDFSVRSVAFSPDGQCLASGSASYVGLWSLANGQAKGFKGHDNWVFSIAFSVDGQRLASGSHDKIIRLWSLADGTPEMFEGHGNSVTSVAFSPDGLSLGSGSTDSSVRHWSLANGKAEVFNGHEKLVNCVAFSPDGLCLASGSDDSTLRLWSLANGEAKVFRGHEYSVYCIAFSSDGQRLASGSFDGTVRLWSLASGNSEVLKGHGASVWSVAFSPDGQSLASGSSDNTVRVWSLASGNAEVFKGHKNSVLNVAFSPDGQRLASGSRDNTVRLWDIAASLAATSDAEQELAVRVLRGHLGSVTSVAFMPWPKGDVSGPDILVSASTDGTIRIWDCTTGECLGILLAQGDAWAAVRPDGRYRVVGDMRQALWHCAGLVRYELGELDGVMPELKLGDNEPLVPRLANNVL